MNNVIGLVAIVLLIIIVYLFMRIRQKMRGVPGARDDMNTMELVRNWQEAKAEDAQRHAELRERARREAQGEIERTLIEKYKREEIAKATSTGSDRAKTLFKEGLGIDSDKVFAKENVDRMVGSKNSMGGIKPGVNSDKIFDRDRISGMTKNNISQDKIRGASGSIQWDSGVKRGLENNQRYSGLDRALGRDKPPRSGRRI